MVEKEEFLEPEMEIIQLTESDVIVTSGNVQSFGSPMGTIEF